MQQGFYGALTKDEQQEGFFGYSNKIDEMNQQAERNYQLKPYNISVSNCSELIQPYFLYG
jgi:hypothetical protein